MRQYGADGSWSHEGVILFDGRSADPLWRVPAAGGVRQPVVFEDGKPEGTPGAGWPEFLPDGKHFLYHGWAARTDMTLMVGSLDSKVSKTLFKTTSKVQYAEPGYLLFVREQTLVAQKFDVGSLTRGRRAGAARRRPGRRRSGPGVVLGVAQRRAGLPGGRADRHAAGVAGSQREGDAGPRRTGRLPRHVAVARRHASSPTT